MLGSARVVFFFFLFWKGAVGLGGCGVFGTYSSWWQRNCWPLPDCQCAASVWIPRCQTEPFLSEMRCTLDPRPSETAPLKIDMKDGYQSNVHWFLRNRQTFNFPQHPVHRLVCSFHRHFSFSFSCGHLPIWTLGEPPSAHPHKTSRTETDKFTIFSMSTLELSSSTKKKKESDIPCSLPWGC